MSTCGKGINEKTSIENEGETTIGLHDTTKQILNEDKETGNVEVLVYQNTDIPSNFIGKSVICDADINRTLEEDDVGPSSVHYVVLAGGDDATDIVVQSIDRQTHSEIDVAQYSVNSSSEVTEDATLKQVVHSNCADTQGQLLSQEVSSSQDAGCQTAESEDEDITDPSGVGKSNNKIGSKPEKKTTLYISASQMSPTSAMSSGQSPCTNVHAVVNEPFNINDLSEAVINGIRCVLIKNEKTGELTAYPVQEAADMFKKKRGRPKKQVSGEAVAPDQAVLEKDETDEETETGESKTDAVEGLLELSNTGVDGVRRSGRKRKKATTLEDYETPGIGGKGHSENKVSEEKLSANKPVFAPPAFIIGGVKRRRGRPRRYPLPGQPTPTHIPAVMIPAANGQTLLMAPIQGLQKLQAFQQAAKSLPTLVPKPVTVGPRQLIVHQSSLGTILPKDGGDNYNCSVLVSSEECVSAVEGILDMNAARVGAGDGNTVKCPVIYDEISEILGSNDIFEAPTHISMTTAETPDGQVTILQIPDNAAYAKKEPVKLGLKASSDELKKLKCPRCDFQAYYYQQYQQHISSHEEDLHRCRCCKYLTFNRVDLICHIRSVHPRCICEICDFTAEHAYVIKRHMMRHNDDGCSCDICGKVYKDPYILKMHVKMVHMPADVLFECMTCDKKFTRKAHLKRHLRIHDPEKPFKCAHCEYRGCEKSDISKHMLIHQDPQYACEVCGKAFRHIKNKELHVKRHRGQKDYKCGVCGVYGYTFTDIRKHIERKHSELKDHTYICEKCGSSFKNGVLLSEHRANCDEIMNVEQALSICEGESSPAMFRLPSSVPAALSSQQVTVNGIQVNITVEEVNMEELEVDLEEHGITFMEEPLAKNHITVDQTAEVQVADDPELDSMAGSTISHIQIHNGVVVTASETDQDIAAVT